uniref:Bestrophin homolog n=1 Tax=Parascaris univalens TaxID=6257 RepID=A0A915BQ29_PARUN
MTISYQGNFCRLLLRWKGSIWRLVWKELLVFLCLYYAVRLFYKKVLPMLGDDDSERYRRKFEQLALMFDEYTKLIPLTFLLGFYVSNVVSRWWRQFQSLPWPEDLLSVLCLVIPGRDEKSQRRRHTIARYVNLTAALAWREISSKIRRRFPTIRHIVDSGLMTEKEFELLNKISSEVKNVRWMTPLHWVQQILADEIKDNAPMASLTNQFVQELKQYRSALRKLFCHDWVCVPLVYTQVAALATYAYFAFCLLGRQFLDPEKKYKRYEIDFVVPIFTIVQFLFFVGWFKVGQDLMRPFGMDDDDIELDYIFERNVATSFAIVNRLQMTEYVPLENDAFWSSSNENKIQAIPHTGLSCQTKQHRPVRHVPSYQPINRDDVEDGNARCAAILKKWKGYDEVIW